MSKVGIICNIERDRFFILTEQGDFVMRTGKPPAGKGLGDRVDLASANRNWKRGLAIAAALVLVVITSLQLAPGAPAQADYRLALDINPSLELVYTEDYQLIDWTAYNEAGREVLQDLEQPEDLYAALEAVFARCVELELARDEHDIFVTTEDGAPLDDDRLLGAFEGHGTPVSLHVVRLQKEEYKADSGSPLRGYLKRKTGTELAESAPVAAAALSSLDSELITTLEVMPWHNNPVVQAFVEKYLVSGSMVEEMLDTGLTSDEVANLLELAQTEKVSPGDIFKELRSSGLPPGQFLQEHKSPGTAKAPDLAAPDWFPDLLAQEFGHSAGQLSSYLRKGLDSADLQALLVIEALGGGKLQDLVRQRESASVEAMLREAGVDSGQFSLHRQRVQEVVQTAETWADDHAVTSLSAEYKLAKAEVLYILGRGYSIDEARDIIRSKPQGKGSIKQYLDDLEHGGDSSNPGTGKPGNESPPGQSDEGPGNGAVNPGKGKGN